MRSVALRGKSHELQIVGGMESSWGERGTGGVLVVVILAWILEWVLHASVLLVEAMDLQC